jgi:RHS repeat-associated protein
MTSSTALIHYIYDPLDRILGHQIADEPAMLHFYQDDQLVLQARQDRQRRFLRDGPHLLAHSDQSGSTTQVALLGTDQQSSVLQVLTGSERTDRAYTPYGAQPVLEEIDELMGYNGQLPDPVTGCYLLGNGQRVYSPGLMRFHSPDTMSPFGAGGINPYAYCLGDPINLVDPTGHFSWKSILGIGIAIVSIALTVATLGSAAPLTGPAIVASLLNIGSDMLDVASTLAEELAPDSKAGAVLGQLSMALSVGSLGAKQIGKRAALGAGRKIGRSAKSPLTRQGAIKVTNGSSLQGFKGAAGLTKAARNTVVIGERLESAREVVNYIDYAYAVVAGVDAYVLPYLNPPKSTQQDDGTSSFDQLAGPLNSSGLQANIEIEFADFLHDESNRSRDIRAS